MTAPQRAQFSNSANIVDEIFTEARIDALNTKLIERGISADQVIAILPVEGQIMAQSDAAAVPGALPDGVNDLCCRRPAV
jgi:hypothetical protein